MWKKIGMLFLILMTGCPALGALRIDVTGAISEPTPVAMPYFNASGWRQQNIADSITDVIAADLERSGLFRIIDRDAYIQKIHSVDTHPHFADWQAVNAHALVHGEINEDPVSGELHVSFRLWDVYAQEQMEAKVLSTTPDSWRRMAHIIADQIYERLTGEKGYFDTKVVFISESGNQANRMKRLAVMDQDGANVQYLTDGKDMVLTPRFSPNMREVTYFSYKDGRPKVYIMDIVTGKSRLVGDFPGMTFAPRFSPDGKKLVMSLATRGNSDIYTVDLDSLKKKRLTDHPAIDTSPSFSPDGQRIVFNSDRGGTQQLYVMDAEGKNVKRISFGSGTYATPVWSPRGDYIAFTKIEENQFHIGLMRPDGSGERLIANGFLVEAPTFAPNGRVVMFFRQVPSDERGRGGASKLYSIDVTGYNERLIKTPEDASDPTWSPLLH